MAESNIIAMPVVDFSAYSLDKPRPARGPANDVHVRDLVDEVQRAFRTMGFLYLKNHGIDKIQIQRSFEASKKFFVLPEDIKMKYDMATLSKYGYVHGYVRMEAERSDTVVPHGDLKECFNYLHNIEPDSFTSDTDVVADFKATMSDFFKSCAELSQRLLEIIGRGMELEDPRIFLKAHDGIIGGDNRSVLRTLYYPALEGDHPVKNGQTRCGEHSDYGSLTLLFQDEVGGLQVMSSSGEFVDATPIEGTIIVNIGDLMQRWTSDKLVSTRHRVLVPSSVDKKRKTRQSIAFFANPNCKHLITPVDACDKYPPITVADFLKMKLDSTY